MTDICIAEMMDDRHQLRRIIPISFFLFSGVQGPERSKQLSTNHLGISHTDGAIGRGGGWDFYYGDWVRSTQQRTAPTVVTLQFSLCKESTSSMRGERSKVKKVYTLEGKCPK